MASRLSRLSTGSNRTRAASLSPDRGLEETELFGRGRNRWLEDELDDRRRRGRLRTEDRREAREIRLEHFEHRRRVERRGRVVERIEDDAAAGDRQLLLMPVHTRDAERAA